MSYKLDWGERYGLKAFEPLQEEGVFDMESAKGMPILQEAGPTKIECRSL